MAKKAQSARSFAEMSLEQIWALPDGPLTLQFDDGIIHTETRRTIFSWYIWEFHRRYPKTPLLKRHHIGDARLGKGTHIQLLTNALWDCWDQYGDRYVDREELSKLAYEITNQLYNDATRKLEAYVSSISALDFLEVSDHPVVDEANRKVQPNSKTTDYTVDKTHNVIKAVLNDAKELPGNGVAKAARSGLVSMGQVLQCVGPRGYTTDIDSNIFPNPILPGFFEGMRTLEDAMKESRSAAKALFFAKAPMEDSEYFNRELQLSAATLTNLHYGDCGSTEYVPFTVRPGDIDTGLAGIYYLNDKGAIEPITKDHKHLVGKTIHIRTVFNCNHADPYGVCSTCFGDLALSIPYGTNIGHFCTAVFQGEIGQRLLSTKHEDGTSSVETEPLDDYTKKFISIFGDENILGLTKRLNGKKVTMTIPEEGAKNLYDVSYVEQVSNLVTTRITEITEVKFDIVHKNDKTETAVVDISNGPRCASLTHQALAFIKDRGWEMDSDGSYVIDITDWDINNPMFELPLKHHSMVAFLATISKVIKSAGRKKDNDRMIDYKDPGQALGMLYELMSSKMDISITHLQVAMFTMMARDPSNNDFRLPDKDHQGEFVNYRTAMFMRSLAPMMAYQSQAKALVSVKSFIVRKRPRHPLDPLLMG